MSLATVDREAFERDGFLRVPAVLSSEEIASLRSSARRIFAEESIYPGDINDRPGKLAIRINFCARYPELRWLLLHPKLLSVLRSLLGEDFLFLPEMSAHASGYGGWHKDTTAQQNAGHMFQWEPDYLMVQVAIYLQDNDASGGGLSVVSGSHLKPDRWLHPSYVKRALWLLRKRLRPFLGTLVDPGSQQIPSRAGDLVLFNFRTDHIASTPRWNRRPKQEKFALFFACSANNRHALTYRAFIQSRPTYKYLREGVLYPPDLLDLAREHRVNLMP